MRISTTRRILLAAAAVAFTHVADGATRSWTGTTSNVFSLNTNWLGGAAPGSGDDVSFTSTGVIRSLVVVNASTPIQSLGISGNPGVGPYEFQKQNNATLTVSGRARHFSGTTAFNGFQLAAGSLQVEGGVLNLSNDAAISVVAQSSILNSGAANVATATWSSANFAMGDGTLNINNGGTVSVTSLFSTLLTGARVNINTGGLLSTNLLQLYSGTMTVNGTGTLQANGTTVGSLGFLQVNRNLALTGGRTMSIVGGGDLATTGFLDIGNGGTADFSVDGAGSSANVATDAGATFAYWGFGSNTTVNFSNSGTGDFNRGVSVAAGTFGTTTVKVLSGANLNIDSVFSTGGAGATADITINGASLVSTGITQFLSGTTVNLQTGGVLAFGDVKIDTGATLNWTGGALSLTPGKNISVVGGAIENSSGGYALPNGSTIRVVTGGKFHNSSFLDIANGNATGTLAVDGVGSEYTNAGTTPTDWGASTGNAATVVFSNSAVGTISALRMSTSGGTSRLTVSSNANLTLGTLAAGNGTLTPTASITVNGGNLRIDGSAAFAKGSSVSLLSGQLDFGGNATFATDSSLNQTDGVFLSPFASVLSVEGGSLAFSNVTFDAATDIRLSSGNVFFNGFTAISGAIFNWTGGNFYLASGQTLSFDAGAGSFSSSYGLKNATISVTHGGSLTSNSFLDIGRTAANSGTLLVDGAGSTYTLGNATSAQSDWGQSTTASAYVRFSNSAVGSLASGVTMGNGGGAATLDILSSARLNTASLIAGNGGGSSDGVRINVNNGTLNIVNAAALSTGAIISYSGGSLAIGGALTMDGNAQINFTAGGKTLGVGSPTSGGTLTMSGTSKIDLSNGSMTIDYSGTSPAATIAAYLAIGRNGGLWTGNALTSSTAASVAANAANTHKTAVGYTDNASSTLVTIAYAYLGDTNLDRTVDTRDFATLVANFGLANRQWYQGDFDYTGTVTSTDFTQFVSNYGLTLPATAAEPILPGALVPEPSVFAALAAVGLLTRRRRMGR